jgi:3-oxoacyl-[acyl-carrier protein] reductase
VVITGAGGIYGSWLARAFAGAGARLMLTDRDPASLEALAACLGGDHLIEVAELTEDGAIDALLDRVGSAWGSADILVNNAGVYPSGFLLDIAAAEWDRILDVNLRAPFLLTRGIARQMIGAGVAGSILMISSAAAHRVRSSVVPYCVSKAALERLTRGFALELAGHGIRVNAIEPGFVPGSAVSPLTAAHVASTGASIPLGRQSAPGDAAAAALYLCSDAAAYVTGTSLAVDGGIASGSMAVYLDENRAP